MEISDSETLSLPHIGAFSSRFIIEEPIIRSRKKMEYV
jgi:hypothetical protein